jgi:hypothetical protein
MISRQIYHVLAGLRFVRRTQDPLHNFRCTKVFDCEQRELAAALEDQGRQLGAGDPAAQQRTLSCVSAHGNGLADHLWML